MDEDLTVNWVQLAIDNGQLVYTDDVYDDDHDSPTSGKFIATYQGTKGLTDGR